MAIEKVKYICYLVSKKAGVQTIGVVRETETMMHVHFLTRNCTSEVIPYRVDGEASMHKVSFQVKNYEAAFSEKEAVEIQQQVFEDSQKMSKLLADD